MKTITSIFLIVLCVYSFSQNDESIASYLKTNLSVYNEKTGLMKSNEYDNYKLFVTGEYHFKQENSKIFLKVFRELYYNANVRVILFESGYAYGIICQHYLETGNKESLKRIASEGQFSDIHYRHLKEFYDKLPADDKFTITGIDLDSYSAGRIFTYTTELIFRDTIIPDELRELLDEFDEICRSESYETIQKSFSPLYLNISQNTDLYSNLLGARYYELEELFSRMRSSLKFDYYNYNKGQDSIAQTKRETYIYRNAVKEIKKNPIVKYFGQFGLAHIGLNRFMIMDKASGVQSFNAKLNSNENSPVKDSVCSIAILYFEDNNNYYSKLIFFVNELKYSTSLKKILPPKVYKVLKRNSETDKLYYVNLNKKQSPLNDFANKNFQYIIFKR